VERVKLSVDVPRELVEEIDEIVSLMGFEGREQFVESAIRRLLDEYRRLIKRIAMLK